MRRVMRPPTDDVRRVRENRANESFEIPDLSPILRLGTPRAAHLVDERADPIARMRALRLARPMLMRPGSADDRPGGEAQVRPARSGQRLAIVDPDIEVVGARDGAVGRLVRALLQAYTHPQRRGLRQPWREIRADTLDSKSPVRSPDGVCSRVAVPDVRRLECLATSILSSALPPYRKLARWRIVESTSGAAGTAPSKCAARPDRPAAARGRSRIE